MSEEPSGRDLQRLRTLEQRLERETEDKKVIRTERNQLRRQLTACEKKVEQLQAQLAECQEVRQHLQTELERLTAENHELRQALEQQKQAFESQINDLKQQLNAVRQQAAETIKTLQAQVASLQTELAEALAKIDELTGGEQTIPELLAENQRLAALIGTNADDLERFRQAADEASTELQSVQAELAQTHQAKDTLTQDLQQATVARQNLEGQVALLTEQVEAQGGTPLLPADKVAGLIGDLVGQIQTGLTGMSIRDSEIRLQVGFGGVGEQVGFVIPTPDSSAEVRENLHEIVLRFNRTPVLSNAENS